MSLNPEQEAALRANTTTGDTFDVHSASVAAWRNVWELVDQARASLDTEREMRQALEASQANLAVIARGGDATLPVSGVCVEVRDRLAAERKHVSEVVVDMLYPALRASISADLDTVEEHVRAAINKCELHAARRAAGVSNV